jgi:uncharacterized membrane protein YjdF
MAFLGTQGDVWDAQKDTISAMIGSLINLTLYKNYKYLWFSKKDQQKAQTSNS